MSTILLLSGPSCSGKTSLAHALQSQVPIPMVLIEADRVFPTLPSAHPLWVAKDQHEATVLAFHRSVAAWANDGFDLIVDGSLPYGMSPLRAKCLEVLAPFNLLVVGVRCDSDLLAEREQRRGVKELGWGVRQSRDINDGLLLDAEADTSSETPEDCARDIIGILNRGGHL